MYVVYAVRKEFPALLVYEKIKDFPDKQSTVNFVSELLETYKHIKISKEDSKR